jgi:hypothetical protein
MPTADPEKINSSKNLSKPTTIAKAPLPEKKSAPADAKVKIKMT